MNNNKLQVFKSEVNRCLPEFQKVATKHLTAERVVKLAHMAASKNPMLLLCDPISVLKCVAVFAQLGLEFDTPLGNAYLIPYKNQCTPIIGYRGLIELARRSGNIKSIEARIVYETDTFEIQFGIDPKLSHTPDWDAQRTDDRIRFVYAVCHFLEGGYQFEVMTKSEIEAVRASSRCGKTGPWVSHYAEMCRKTVIRRLAKYLPLTSELAQGIAVSDQEDIGRGKPIQVFTDEGVEILAQENEPTSKAEQLFEKALESE